MSNGGTDLIPNNNVEVILVKYCDSDGKRFEMNQLMEGSEVKLFDENGALVETKMFASNKRKIALQYGERFIGSDIIAETLVDL